MEREPKWAMGPLGGGAWLCCPIWYARDGGGGCHATARLEPLCYSFLRMSWVA